MCGGRTVPWVWFTFWLMVILLKIKDVCGSWVFVVDFRVFFGFYAGFFGVYLQFSLVQNVGQSAVLADKTWCFEKWSGRGSFIGQ